jgi:hypothetical protein
MTRRARFRVSTVLAGLAVSFVSYGAAGLRVPAELGPAAPAACSIAPETVALRPTANAPGGRGAMILALPDSPFGVTVDTEGRQAYEVAVTVERMRKRDGATYVVWAATPELDRHARLGVLGPDNRVTAPVAWNKFMVFVSEETDPGVERWEGPIMLTGLSPSGRMHTMAGHGPFEDVNCADFGW